MAYIDQDDVENLMGDFTIPAQWTTAMDDTVTPLAKAIANAEDTIDGVTHNRFEKTTRKLQLKGDGTDSLETSTFTLWPLYSVTSITERDSYDDSFADDGEVVSADSYEISVSRRALINHYSIWTRAKFYNYQLIAIFGYAIVPKTIQEAAVLLVQNLITPGTADRFASFESERFSDGYQYTRKGQASTEVQGAPNLTGFQAVDIRLARFMVKFPMVIGL